MSEKERMRLILKNSEIYEGEVINITENHIHLRKVYCTQNGNEINTQMMFDKREIEKSEKLENIIKFKNTPHSLQLTEQEFRELTEMTTNYIYQKQINETYTEAIGKLEKAENIGVIGLGNQQNLSNPLSLLIMNTYDQIYLFDMQKLGKTDFIKDLRSIMQSLRIMKIIHNAKPLLEQLEKKYGITVENIFDTQKAHEVITNKKNVNISECLQHHFGFTPDILEVPLNEMLKDESWNERPLCENSKVYAAQLVVYLWKLRHFMEKLLLKSFYEQVNQHYKEHYMKTDMELLFEINGLDITEINE